MSKLRRIPLGADNFLSVLEGIEGGFAIFAGIIVGLSFEVSNREVLLLTGLVGIIVSAFNTSAVRYSSEHYLDELDGHEKRRAFWTYFVPSVVEFASYAIVSMIAVLPLLWIEPLGLAIWMVVALTLGILFCAGWYRGWLLARHHRLRDGLEVAILGGLIIAIGAAAGWIASHFVA